MALNTTHWLIIGLGILALVIFVAAIAYNRRRREAKTAPEVMSDEEARAAEALRRWRRQTLGI